MGSDTQMGVSSKLCSYSNMNKLFLVTLTILAALAQGGVVQREDAVAELSAVGEAEEVENIMEDVDDEEDELDDEDWEDDEDEDDLEDDDEDDEDDDDEEL